MYFLCYVGGGSQAVTTSYFDLQGAAGAGTGTECFMLTQADLRGAVVDRDTRSDFGVPRKPRRPPAVVDDRPDPRDSRPPRGNPSRTADDRAWSPPRGDRHHEDWGNPPTRADRAGYRGSDYLGNVPRGTPWETRGSSPPRGGRREDRESYPRAGGDRAGEDQGSNPPRGDRGDGEFRGSPPAGRGHRVVTDDSVAMPARKGLAALLMASDDRGSGGAGSGDNSPAAARKRAAALARSATSVTATDSPRQRPLKPVSSNTVVVGLVNMLLMLCCNELRRFRLVDVSPLSRHCPGQ